MAAGSHVALAMGKCALTRRGRIAHPAAAMTDAPSLHNATPNWLITADVDLAALTPVMRQVVDAKRRHPDALILFRLGDFYELFFEDALEGSRLLDLALEHENLLLLGAGRSSIRFRPSLSGKTR